jgi:hypothetical protein
MTSVRRLRPHTLAEYQRIGWDRMTWPQREALLLHCHYVTHFLWEDVPDAIREIMPPWAQARIDWPTPEKRRRWRAWEDALARGRQITERLMSEENGDA